MINERGLHQFERFGDHLLKPLYGDYSFGAIPTTIHYLLTGEQRGTLLPVDCFGGHYPRPQKILLLFIDSFGWAFWQRYGERFATTRHLLQHGVLTPISALFPSTTSASVSTMNLDVLPSQHALYEWNIYIEAYGEVIQSLVFTPLGRHPQDAGLALGYDPRLLLRRHETVYQRLAQHGVRPIQFAHRGYARSAYNSITSAGAEVITHRTLGEALVQINTALTTVNERALLSFYWSDIDSVAHYYGPGTPYHEAEIVSFWSVIDALLADLPADTLLLVTADHGQVYADPATTFYVNKELPGLADALPLSPTGQPIYPNGSPRDLFLHLRPERRAEARQRLSEALDGRATVLSVDEALDQGLFGPPPFDPVFRGRLGDLLVLPYAGQYVSWYEADRLENRFFGHHGGLAADELITVLGALMG